MNFQRLSLVAAALLITGCAAYAPPSGLPPQPSSACATPVASARAWMDRMPVVGERGAQLHVQLELAARDQAAVLTEVRSGRPGRMVLQLRPAEISATPGIAAWRGGPLARPYPVIEIQCGGGVEAIISDILEVE